MICDDRPWELSFLSHKPAQWDEWCMILNEDFFYVLTGKNPGGIGPPGIPSWGFIWPNGLGAAAFCKDKPQKII